MRYSIGSISKQFTAAAILLCRNGQASLDDKSANLFQHYARERSNHSPASFAHLRLSDYWPQDYVMP